MSILWVNKFKCPGFIFCPRKPWSFGNEWHTITCSLCMVIFWVELVEGKNHPKEMGEPKYAMYTCCKGEEMKTMSSD